VIKSLFTVSKTHQPFALSAEVLLLNTGDLILEVVEIVEQLRMLREGSLEKLELGMSFTQTARWKLSLTQLGYVCTETAEGLDITWEELVDHIDDGGSPDD
jgi:hypothetical protein